jgi:hypothetical protein
MNDNDSTEFQELLDTNFKLYNKTCPDIEVKRAWWKLLRNFDLINIKAAFGKHTRVAKYSLAK